MMSNMNNNELASAQVEAFIEILSKRYGIKEEEIPELIAALKWAANHRNTIGKLTIAGIVAFITTIIGGIMITVWESFKHIIGKV